MKVKRISKLMWKTYLFGGRNNLAYPNNKYLSYITPYDVVQGVMKQAGKYFNGLQDKIFYDMFAGIGTDTIQFAKGVKRVYAYEINKETFDCGVANISGFSNITYSHQDCTEIQSDMITEAIAYFDPPWGRNFRPGESFSFENETLENGIPVLALLKNIPCRYIIIKSPLLCESFETAFPAHFIANIMLFTQQKLKFIFIVKPDKPGKGDKGEKGEKGEKPGTPVQQV